MRIGPPSKIHTSPCLERRSGKPRKPSPSCAESLACYFFIEPFWRESTRIHFGTVWKQGFEARFPLVHLKTKGKPPIGFPSCRTTLEGKDSVGGVIFFSSTTGIALAQAFWRLPYCQEGCRNWDTRMLYQAPLPEFLDFVLFGLPLFVANNHVGWHSTSLLW